MEQPPTTVFDPQWRGSEFPASLCALLARMGAPADDGPREPALPPKLQPAQPSPILAPERWTASALSSLLDAVPEALIVAMPGNLVALASAEARRLLGYSAAELLNQDLRRIIPLQRDPPAEGAAGGAGESWLNAAVPREMVARRKDGTPIPVEVDLRRVHTEQGQLVVIALRDVSRRKKWETRYRMLVEEIPAVTFLASLDGDVNELYVSPQIETMLGFTQQQWLEDPMLWFRQLHPEDMGRWQEEFAQTVACGQPFRSVYRFIARDGRTVWVHGEARLVRDHAGIPQFLQGIAFDITERKEAENLLRRSREELEAQVRQRTAELQQANKVLAADIARREIIEEQLRTAQEDLQTINSTLEQKVSQRTTELEHQADALRRLAAQLTDAEQVERRRLARLMHDHLQQLLVAAKLRVDALHSAAAGSKWEQSLVESGQILRDALEATRNLTAELVPPVLYEQGLAAALEWVAQRLRQQQKLDVTLTLSAQAEPASDQVKALLFESARELLFNVAKYATEKTARVTLERGPAGEIRLIVCDDGPGFDPAVIDARPQAAGGFGLFSIRERVRALGGVCEVESRPGHCSRVQVVLPAEYAGGDKQAIIQVPAAAARGPNRASHSGGGRRHTVRVLLVDDHKIVREGVANLLREVPDIELVGQAADGVEAVEMTRQLQPDIVIMDLNMPRMGGRQALQILAAEQPRTHVICLSMQSAEHMAEAMLACGASAYLNKAGDPQELIRTVLQCAGREKHAPAPSPTAAPRG